MQTIRKRNNKQLQMPSSSERGFFKDEEERAFEKHWLENDGGGQIYLTIDDYKDCVIDEDIEPLR